MSKTVAALKTGDIAFIDHNTSCVIIIAVVSTWCFLRLPHLRCGAEVHVITLHFKPLITFVGSCVMLFNQTAFLHTGHHSAVNTIFQSKSCVSK
jgi:hypothetical protein